MKDMPKLFDVEFEHPDEIKASNFISELHEVDYVGINMVYLTNYINSDIGVALSHIKEGYKNYVCNGNWSEEKYKDIVYLISKDRQMLIPSVFLRYGTKYDDGKLNREINLERRKYKIVNKDNEEKISIEEQELLDYIAKHGGR